jgi:hypothetical protein
MEAAMEAAMEATTEGLRGSEDIPFFFYIMYN